MQIARFSILHTCVYYSFHYLYTIYICNTNYVANAYHCISYIHAYICSILFSIGLAQNLTVSVRPANNFPLDVYFLMDQSFSMNDDLQSFKTLASQLGMQL